MIDVSDGAIEHAKAQENLEAFRKEKSVPPNEIILEEINDVQGEIKNAITWKEAQAGSDGGLDTLMLSEMSPAELTQFGVENEDWEVTFGRDGSCDQHDGQVLGRGQLINICKPGRSLHFLFKVKKINEKCGGEKKVFLVLQRVLDQDEKEVTDEFLISMFFNKLKKAIGEFLSMQK